MIWLYTKEKIKSKMYQIISKRMKQFHRPMDQVVLQLKARGYWDENTKPLALEMFGMFGLWMFCDYQSYARRIDFFEIDPQIIKYARKAWKRYEKINFICGDSIEYLKATNERYDLIVSDTPYGFEKYVKEGVPVYLMDAVEVANRGGVIVVGIHTDCLKDADLYTERVRNLNPERIHDVFYVVRNTKMSLLVLLLAK